MGKITDEQLIQDIFYIYTNSQSIKEFNKNIDEYIKKNKINKTTSYLRLLLEEYKKTVPKDTLEYEMIQNTKYIHKQESSNKKIVEALSKMSDEEIQEFIKENDLPSIRIKFQKYIKSIDDIKLIEETKKVLERMNNIKINTYNEQKQKERKIKYESALNLFDLMTNEGFFDFIEFKRRYHEKYQLNEEDFYGIIDRYKKLLREKYPEKYAEYMEKIQMNKKKKMIELQKQIDSMLELLPDNYDIIDYYLNIQMPIDIFKRLSTEFFNAEQTIKLNKFIHKYIDPMSNTIKYPLWVNIGQQASINGELVTQELQEKLLGLMKKYEIPNNYFIICYNKYKKGQLDSYLEQKSKEVR